MGLTEWIIPQEKKFFDLIDSEVKKIHEGVVLLNSLIENFSNVEEKKNRLKVLENESDAIVHNIFDELNRSFITPIDREDISNLSLILDDIIDESYVAANRIVIYNIKKPTSFMIKQTNALVKASDEIRKISAKLRDMGNDHMHESCKEIHRIEKHADEIMNEALAELFKEKNALEIIKIKDIYEALEAAIDKCEIVADIINNIMIKHG
jgi:uncharacterized protein